MYGVGFVPRTTDDPEEAFRLWSSEGAVILATGRTDAEGMLEGTEAVFGEHLVSHQGFSHVGANRTPGEDTYFDPATRTVHANAGVILELHVDGYMAFGQRFPDLVCLLCQRQAAVGGDSFLVDGLRLVEAIDADPAEAELSRFAWEVPIEQSRPEGKGPSGTAKPVPHRRPIAVRSEGGRLTTLYHEHQRLVDDEPPRPEDQALLARWQAIVAREAEAAPRFLLQAGDLCCMDNYRVFHGRDPYAGFDRLLHKLWAWTDASFGIPDRGDVVARGRPAIVSGSAR
jgi:alpha-ketoglutarate-dependent taurine dioxygenase